MNAKQYLKQAYRLNELIKNNQQELDELQELSTNLPGTDYSKDRIQSSPSGDATYVRIVEKIVELEKIIQKDIEELLSLKLEIRNVINEIDDNEHKLLLMCRYLNFMTWDDICEKMNVSSRTVHRIHGNALLNVKVPEKYS